MLIAYFPFVLLFFNQISASVTLNPFLQDRYTLSDLFNTLSKVVLELPNDECKNQIISLVSSSMQDQEWLIKMVDAFAKPQAGILAGNVMHIGNYDECLSINFDKIQGKYCTVLFGPHPEYGRNLSSLLTQFLASITKIDDDKVLVTDAKYSYGFCVPKICTTEDLQTLVNLLEDDLEFLFHFTFMEEYCDGGDARPFTTSAIVGIIIFSFFGVLLVVSTIYDVFYCEQDETNPSLLHAFSVWSNGKKILNTSSPEGNLGCLNGLRVISMAWIVLCHSFQHAIFLPHINSGDLITYWKNSTGTAFIAAGPMAVDTFFTVSGLLVVYLIIKSRQKGVKFSLPMFYLHRIIRLTPSLIMVIVFTVTLINYVGRGPFWPLVSEMLYKPCESNWWSTLIYLQNYINPNEQCVGQAWYLAVDTQMYFLSPLIFFPLIKWPKPTIGAIIILVILNCGYVFEITWKKHLATTFFDQDQMQYNYIYSPTHVRGTVYLIGMICGYFVYKTRTRPFKLSKNKIVFLWIFSLSVMLAIVLGHSAMFKYEYNVLGASFFNSLTRVGWSIAICIVILLCVNDYGGPINTFLSWPVFTVLIRLNYNIYLLHLALMMITVSQERSSTYFSVLGGFHYFWGDYVFAVSASVLWTLAFESPVLTIEKIIFGRKKHGSKGVESGPDSTKKNNNKDFVSVQINENGTSSSVPSKTD